MLSPDQQYEEDIQNEMRTNARFILYDYDRLCWGEFPGGTTFGQVLSGQDL